MTETYVLKKNRERHTHEKQVQTHKTTHHQKPDSQCSSFNYLGTLFLNVPKSFLVVIIMLFKGYKSVSYNNLLTLFLQ